MSRRDGRNKYKKFPPPSRGRIQVGGLNEATPHPFLPPQGGKEKAGLTLIEVMVAISIASILTLGIERLLDTALTSWRFAFEEASISRFSEDAIRRMMEGDYTLPGIRDAVEIVSASDESLEFVPFWTDFYGQIPKDGAFILSKRLRRGAPPPVGEIRFKKSDEFRTYPAEVHREGAGGKDLVVFGFPLQGAAQARLTYHPDYKIHPELVMRFAWDQKSGKILRRYNGEMTDFDLSREGIQVKSVRFSYFDGYNQAIKPLPKKPLGPNALVRISAVKSELTFQGKELFQTGSSFTNIRALGKAGRGIILAEDLEVPIPDSETVQVLQLSNFTGVDEGQVLEFKIKSLQARETYRLKLYLGLEGNLPILRRYEVYYPSKELAVESDQETSLEHGFNLLELGGDGLYDYDVDDGVADKVEFKGDGVVLTVLQMDVPAAMLVIRP